MGDETFGVAQAVRGLAGAVAKSGAGALILALQDGAFAAECRQAGMEVEALALPLPVTVAGGLYRRAVAYHRLQKYRRSAAPKPGVPPTILQHGSQRVNPQHRAAAPRPAWAAWRFHLQGAIFIFGQ